ncbi:uncharacterized protein LOC129768687 isoform X2 [Toxorhynchites rutilus septentrionalis]|nr:uncharacterized protein LOC129768687 isoform X2 [Toxorhynchites rutilus septentrionalis]XP_055626474.1 uncharacterized protein LOC129768687 isoform X2 [Toxorhynchites rutilus septentrionalis]XP_055626482.1 uncharacterized protein LOC129768687 isoform X2 [Toxorhynchites rutilus septentrionalis]
MEHSGTNADTITHATVRRPSSIIVPHRIYSQQPYLSTARRERSDHNTGDEGVVAASESFYPSFLRNSRHNFQPSEADRYKIASTGRAKYADTILGSGDFGVLKGGTFYQDNDPPLRSYYNDFFGLNINNHNGHQRPFASPLIQKIRYPSDSLDPFSNFRDFADINVSNDAGQYSEFFVVYANNNSNLLHVGNKDEETTHNEKHVQNIKDQLDLIDKEISIENKLSKLSKSKTKLAKFKKQTCKKCLKGRPNMASSTTSNPQSDKDFMLALS